MVTVFLRLKCHTGTQIDVKPLKLTDSGRRVGPTLKWRVVVESLMSETIGCPDMKC